MIGLTGIEAAFNKFLRGVPGEARVHVNSLGRPLSHRLLTTPPQTGQTVRLTINGKLQVAAQNAIDDGIQRAINDGQWAADGGAIVALNPKDGAILALASSPTYNPAVYSGRVTTRKLAAQGLTAKTDFAGNYPSLDRAVDGDVSAGLDVQAAHRLAAIEEHLIKPYKFYPCTGTYVVAARQLQARLAQLGPHSSTRRWICRRRSPSRATRTSTASATGSTRCLRDRGQPLQKWARRFGFGQMSGSDLGPQAAGLVPTIGWKRQLYTKATTRTGASTASGSPATRSTSRSARAT